MKNIARIQTKSSLGKRRRQGFFPVGVNGGRPSFFKEAYNWVEEHRRGREQFFLQDVELRLENRGRYRRLLIPRYPFGIFYVVESNRIVVHAVPDLRQDPEKIRERFSE